MTDEQLTERFRALLDRMVESRRYPNEYVEEAHDEAVEEIATFPREPRLLTALDKAIGKSKRRRREAVYLVGPLADIPGTVDRIGAWLREGDDETQSWLVQVIGNKGLVALAPALNEVMLNAQAGHAREFAIRAAGNLRADVNLPTLLQLAADPTPYPEYSRIPDSILWALKDYARPECRPHLQRAFEKPTENEDPTLAAWGLCKLGPHPEAHAFLVSLLGDAHRDPETNYSTGVGLRAAQALADAHGWPFKWGQGGVKGVLKRLARMV